MKKIFVVDGSSTMLMSLKSTLEISGFKVETACDGEPKMDGLLLIREARKILRFTPILALTTESQQGKRDEAKKLGATGWLVKPVTGADLVKVVTQVAPG